jgi:light-regulated signal transduction histidine kinase (bacteriophytochrome)
MSVQVFALLSLLSALVVTGLFLANAWGQGHYRPAARAIDPEESRFDLRQAPFSGDVLDVATELRAVLCGQEPAASRQHVRFDLAMQPELAIHIDPAVFRQTLTDAVASAIASAPGGRVMISAFRLGASVHIGVSDDGQYGDFARDGLRPSAELLALHGGRLDIDARPGEGTTVILRLPVASPIRPAEPAPVWEPVETHQRHHEPAALS